MSTPPFCNQFIEIAICGFRPSTNRPNIPRSTPSLKPGALMNCISCSLSTSASSPRHGTPGLWATTVPLCRSIEPIRRLPCSAHSRSLAIRQGRSRPACPLGQRWSSPCGANEKPVPRRRVEALFLSTRLGSQPSSEGGAWPSSSFSPAPPRRGLTTPSI